MIIYSIYKSVIQTSETVRFNISNYESAGVMGRHSLILSILSMFFEICL